jgi:RNA binding exosome subunit
MSFYLAETPTLEAVATEDEQALAEDLQARVAEALQQAESEASVCEAAGAHRQAQDCLDGLRAAERALNRHAKESRERVSEFSERALDNLVEAAAAGKKLEFKRLDEVTAGEAQIRTLGQAIERLAEHLIPRAQVKALREEAHALEAMARALERIAQQRAEKVLEQLRGAVSEEMVLPVDMSKGVAGALLARAAGFKRLAVQVSENADRIGRAHQVINGDRKSS